MSAATLETQTTDGLAKTHEPPLVVDLDGTLIKTDLLIETALGTLGAKPQKILPALKAFAGGKAALKHYFAGECSVDAKTLPYDAAVLELMHAAKAQGRRVVIASAADRRLVDKIAAHLGIVDEVVATENGVNMAHNAKAEALVARFGKGGFDYIGDSKADIPVWADSRRAFVAAGKTSLAASAEPADGAPTVLPGRGSARRALLKAMRPTQWVKNVLVFVPLLTSHHIDLHSVMLCLGAFLAFSLVASGVYLVNDLVDIPSDRAHPTKHKRPFASGRLAPKYGLMAAPVLWLAGVGLASAISLQLLAVVLIYAVATTMYSFSIKRKMLIDVVWLAGLYTVRIYGGAAATGIAISEWLLIFSIFIFTAMALVKRYSELATLLDMGLEDPSNRNYKQTDLPVVASLASSSAMGSIVVIALYVASPEVKALYAHPERLWAMIPVLLYWVSRLVMMSHRRHIDGDPIVFALRDRISWVTGAALAVIIAAAV